MTKKIKCAYHLCNKEIEESKIITRPLHFMRGVIPTTEMKNIVVKSVPKRPDGTRTLIN